MLNQSPNYMWHVEDQNILGRGVSGTVYKGKSRTTDQVVAVKTFVMPSPREIAILQKLKHPNIVEFIAVEQQMYCRNGIARDVLIMNFCSGGNLLEILREPKHINGLCEEEVLRVIGHVTAGLKYLRRNHIVHGDIKPANIMKTMQDNGEVIYLLTDFGAANIVKDGQRSRVLGGTEEFVHPDIFEAVFMGINKHRTFPANVDLWSFGVTCFKIVTGSLPFKACQGRRSRGTMFHIIKDKPEGAISGVQLSYQGKIYYEMDLSHHCNIRPFIKEEITTLLKALLQSNLTKLISYDEFFKRIDDLLTMKEPIEEKEEIVQHKCHRLCTVL